MKVVLFQIADQALNTFGLDTESLTRIDITFVSRSRLTEAACLYLFE